MEKNKKRLLVAGVASSLLLGMCSSAMAATSNVYVGNVGFNLDRVLNETNYETGFKSYLGANIAKGLYIDLDGNFSAVSTDDFLNSTTGQTLTQFEKANETAKTGSIWNGVDPIGETQEIAVESVSAINGTLTVTFNQAPTVAPVAGDFVVTQAIDGAAATTLTPTVTTVDEVSTLAVEPVVATAADQSVVYSVSYKGGAAKAADAFTVAVKDSTAPVITVSAASVNVAAANQAYTFTVVDNAAGAGVDAASIIVKQGTTVLTATAVTGQDNTYQVSLAEVKGASQTLSIDAKDKVGNAASTASVTLVDKTKPTITNVQATNNTTLLVTFSEPLDGTAGANSAISTFAFGDAAKYSLYNKTNGTTARLTSDANANSIQVNAIFANTEKTQVKFSFVAVGANVTGYPAGGMANGGYIFYGSAVNDTATAPNTIVTGSPYEFTGTLTPDATAPALLSSSFNNASGLVTLVFDKITTGVAPVDDKVYFQVGTTKAYLKNATDYAGIAAGSTLTFTVPVAKLAEINSLGANPQIVLASAAFTDGSNAIAEVTSTPTIITGPILNSVTYDENSNTVVYKFSKTIDVSKITTFVNKFFLGGVAIDSANATFNTTANSTDLSFKLSDADAQAKEILLRGGTLTASVVAATVQDTDATPNSNVTASSAVTLTVADFVKDTTAPTLTSSKYNADSKVLELTFNEAIRNTIGDFVGASVELYKDDNGVAGLQTAVVGGVAADTKIASFADTDLLAGVNDHAIIQTGLVTDATGAPAVAATKESSTIFVKDSNGVGTNLLDDSIDAALAVPKEVYVNILAGGVKDANTNVTTAVQSVKVTNIAVSNTTALTTATTVANVSLGEIAVTFANAGGPVAMDATKATDPANYDLYLVANPLNKVSIKNVVMSANNTVANIFFNSPIAAGNYALKTSGLTTSTGVASNIDGTILPAELWTAAANGSVLNATQALTLTDKDTSGTVSAGDEVKLVFSEAVKLPTGFSITDITADNLHSLGNATFALASDNKTLTLTLGSTSTLAVGDKLSFPATIKDLEDVALVTGGGAQTTNGMTVSGNVATKILSALYADTNDDGVVSTGDVLTVKFDQNVTIATGKTAADLVNDIVEGGTSFTAATLSGDTLTLTVGTAAFVVGDSVDVSGTVADVDIVNSWGTKATPTAKAIVKSDVVAPTMTGVSYKAATNELTFAFSEAVNDVTKASANALAAALAADVTVNGGTKGTVFTAATLSSDKKSVTITLDGTEALDQFATVTLAAGTFGDASNNLQDASGNIAVRAQGTPYALTITQ